MVMNGIEINRANRGLVSDGIKPNQLADANAGFSQLLNKAADSQRAHSAKSQENQEKSSSESMADASDTTPGIVSKNMRIDKTDKLYEQCQELETFLVKNILNSMRKNVMKSNLIETGYAGEIYEDMLWDEYAKEYTKNAGFGLADLAYLELSGQRGRKA